MFLEGFSGSKHHMNDCGYVRLFQSWLLSRRQGSAKPPSCF